MNKKNLRSYLFRHLDGIALFMPISILEESGILDFIKKNEKFNIQDIIKKFNCNVGYLNVTLRLLASQGWLKYKIIKDGSNINYELTQKGYNCIQLAHLYKVYSCYIDTLIDIDKLIFSNFSDHKEKDLNILFDTLASFSKETKLNSIEWEVSKHLEGILIGPILVALGMSKAHSIIFANKQSFDIKILSKEIPSIKIDYISQINHPTDLIIGQRISRIGNKSFNIESAIFNKNKEKASVLSNVTCVCYNYNIKKTVMVYDVIKNDFHGKYL